MTTTQIAAITFAVSLFAVEGSLLGISLYNKYKYGEFTPYVSYEIKTEFKTEYDALYDPIVAFAKQCYKEEINEEINEEIEKQIFAKASDFTRRIVKISRRYKNRTGLNFKPMFQKIFSTTELVSYANDEIIGKILNDKQLLAEMGVSDRNPLTQKLLTEILDVCINN